MIEMNHPRLSVAQQCRLLSISRSSFYFPILRVRATGFQPVCFS